VDALLELVRGEVNPWYWEEEGDLVPLADGRLLLLASEEMRHRVAAFLRAREAEALRPLAVDVRVLSVGREGTESARLLHAGTIRCLSGRRAFLRVGDTANYVAGYGAEVAKGSRIADPVVGQSFAGLALDVLPRLSSDGARLSLELWLHLATHEIGDPVTTGAAAIGRSNALVQWRTCLSETVEIPLGETFTIDAGPHGEGRRLAVEIRAIAR